MSNLSISILNVENVVEFLDKLKEYEKKIYKSKVDNLFDITIHFDVMDNMFVPNNGIDIDKIKIVGEKDFIVDTHLMVSKPIEDGYIDKVLEYGCRDITIHYEIDNFNSALKYLIEKKNYYKGDLRIGVSIKPQTDISCLDKYIEYIDKILVMSVEPGFGGQKYIENTTDKLDELKRRFENKFIQVDGGINENTIIYPIRENIDSIVVGSYLTKNTSELYDRLCILNIIKCIEELSKEADLNFEKRILQVRENGYAKYDILLGIRVPILRKLAKSWYNIVSLNALSYFINSTIHDYRRFAIFCLCNIVNKNNRNEIKEFIDKNINNINNWDLVDSCAPICIGKQLLDKDDDKIYNILRKYTKSNNIWIKRIGIVSLLYIAKENRSKAVFKVLDDVFYEDYHLIQKANGWVLRELFKVNPNDVLMYLVSKNQNKKIPSILKSYATEKMSFEQKQMLK